MLDTMQQILQDLRHSSSQIREAALDRVGEMKPDRAIALLVPFLSDTDEGVRETAACNLGFIRENVGNSLSYQNCERGFLRESKSTSASLLSRVPKS